MDPDWRRRNQPFPAHAAIEIGITGLEEEEKKSSKKKNELHFDDTLNSIGQGEANFSSSSSFDLTLLDICTAYTRWTDAICEQKTGRLIVKCKTFGKLPDMSAAQKNESLIKPFPPLTTHTHTHSYTHLEIGAREAF